MPEESVLRGSVYFATTPHMKYRELSRVEKMLDPYIYFSEADVMLVAEKMKITSKKYDELFTRIGRQILSDISNLDEPSEIMSICLSNIEQAIMAFNNHIPEPTDIACRKGCCYCCSFPVECPPQVVQTIAHYMRNTMSLDERKALATQMERYVILSENNTKRLPCPFLDDTKSCLIYAIRPLSCRAFTSPDVQVCKQSVKDGRNIPQQSISYRIYQIATTALLSHAQSQGLPRRQVSFISELLASL